MYAFEYAKPASLADAAAALKAGEDAQLLGGGQTLIPTLKQRLAQPGQLIDLTGLADLRGVQTGADQLTIGGTTTHAAVAASDAVRGMIPALAALAGGIGDRQVRHRGTLGGSIANNDPAADYPAGLLGLGATVRTDRREIAADNFFTGMFETALEEGEIVTAVVFPKPKRAAYVKFPNPASRYAIVGVFAAETAGGPRIAVTGAGPCVFRATAMEAALAKSGWSAEALAGIAIDETHLNADIHASAAYRAHLTGVMARRAVNAA